MRVILAEGVERGGGDTVGVLRFDAAAHDVQDLWLVVDRHADPVADVHFQQVEEALAGNGLVTAVCGAAFGEGVGIGGAAGAQAAQGDRGRWVAWYSSYPSTPPSATCHPMSTSRRTGSI
jgi:hypothetical protein